MIDSLYLSYRATLGCLAKTLEARDYETRGHSDRVVAYCLRLGKEMGLAPADLICLEQGALLHDIGKIAVRDAVLLKPGSLGADEWPLMQKHVEYGLKIIEGTPFLSGACFVVGQHHEKYDGSGYPNGLRGEEIHINARIFAVADAFDAITSDRPYRAAQPYMRAREEIVAGWGSHFDPSVVDAFLQVPAAELAEIRNLAMQENYSTQLIGKAEMEKFMLKLNCSEDLKESLSAICA